MILAMLHVILLAFITALATSKVMPDNSQAQSLGDPIYPDFLKSAIFTAIEAYDRTSTMESGDLNFMKSKVSIVEDIKRIYTE